MPGTGSSDVRRPALIVLTIAAGLLLASACRSRNPAPPPRGGQTSAQTPSDVEATLNEVEAWSVRVSSDAAPSARERVEMLVEGLRSYEDQVKASLHPAASGRVDQKALARDVDDLRNAFDRAIASLPAERHAAETAMGEALSDASDRLAQFRVAATTAGVQGNAEIKRRINELELGRREMGDTLADLKRASGETWAETHRRWQLEIQRWNEQFEEAQGRLPLMPTPVPSATPSPFSRHHSKAPPPPESDH